MNWIYNDWIFFSLFGICIFLGFYAYSQKIISFFNEKSFGTRERIIEIMDKMLWNFDKEKMTWIFLMMTFGVGFILFIAFLPNIILSVIFGIGSIFLISHLSTAIMESLWEKRCDRIVNQMVDGMTIMSNGVKSGLSFVQSMERVQVNIGKPLGDEFKLVLNKIRLGMTTEDALNELSERINRPDMLIFVTAVTILKETGGNLAETFETITQTIRGRQKVQQKVDALTAQGMVQGTIISCVPFVLFFVFMFISPDFIKPVMSSVLGWALIGAAIVLVLLGGYFMRKMVKIDI